MELITTNGTVWRKVRFQNDHKIPDTRVDATFRRRRQTHTHATKTIVQVAFTAAYFFPCEPISKSSISDTGLRPPSELPSHPVQLPTSRRTKSLEEDTRLSLPFSVLLRHPHSPSFRNRSSFSTAMAFHVRTTDRRSPHTIPLLPSSTNPQDSADRQKSTSHSTRNQKKDRTIHS